jgi:hypothetical protein
MEVNFILFLFVSDSFIRIFRISSVVKKKLNTKNILSINYSFPSLQQQNVENVSASCGYGVRVASRRVHYFFIKIKVVYRNKDIAYMFLLILKGYHYTPEDTVYAGLFRATVPVERLDGWFIPVAPTWSIGHP